MSSEDENRLIRKWHGRDSVRRRRGRRLFVLVRLSLGTTLPVAVAAGAVAGDRELSVRTVDGRVLSVRVNPRTGPPLNQVRTVSGC